MCFQCRPESYKDGLKRSFYAEDGFNVGISYATKDVLLFIDYFSADQDYFVFQSERYVCPFYAI